LIRLGSLQPAVTQVRALTQRALRATLSLRRFDTQLAGA
jgi:hypothetical protein